MRREGPAQFGKPFPGSHRFRAQPQPGMGGTLGWRVRGWGPSLPQQLRIEQDGPGLLRAQAPGAGFRNNSLIGALGLQAVGPGTGKDSRECSSSAGFLGFSQPPRAGCLPSHLRCMVWLREMGFHAQCLCPKPKQPRDGEVGGKGPLSVPVWATCWTEQGSCNQQPANSTQCPHHPPTKAGEKLGGFCSPCPLPRGPQSPWEMVYHPSLATPSGGSLDTGHTPRSWTH